MISAACQAGYKRKFLDSSLQYLPGWHHCLFFNSRHAERILTFVFWSEHQIEIIRLQIHLLKVNSVVFYSWCRSLKVHSYIHLAHDAFSVSQNHSCFFLGRLSVIHVPLIESSNLYFVPSFISIAWLGSMLLLVGIWVISLQSWAPFKLSLDWLSSVWGPLFVSRSQGISAGMTLPLYSLW